MANTGILGEKIELENITFTVVGIPSDAELLVSRKMIGVTGTLELVFRTISAEQALRQISARQH